MLQNTNKLRVGAMVATMNLTDLRSLLADMGLSRNVTVINQITDNNLAAVNQDKEEIHLRSYYERGLSRSRNRALDLSDYDICIIADDDMTYMADYEQIIQRAYIENPQADIIAFYVDSEDINDIKPILKAGRVGLLRSMKLRSVQITFRKQSIFKHNIRFNENFGAGAEFNMGEENIFLADCLRAGLNIYSVPIKIATLRTSTSTWFTGYNKHYFNVKGRVFYVMSHKFYPLFILQFAIRKQSLYRSGVSLLQAISYMWSGARDMRQIHEK